jgi:DNA repair protein RadC
MHTDSSTYAVRELRPRLATVQTVIRYLAPTFASLDHEELHILCLDARYSLLAHAHFPVTDDSERDSRAIISTAIAVKGAVNLIFVQSHLEGSPVATVSEKQFRAKLSRALSTVGINLQDHIVFGPERIWSLRQKRTMRWPRTATLH